MAVTPSRPPSLLQLPSYLASQVSKFGRRHLQQALTEHDLLLVHLAILATLDDFGPRSQQHLADCLDIDKSYLVGRIDELEVRELVQRNPDPDDRRRHRLQLTDRGKALVGGLHGIAAESQQPLVEPLSKEERETLVSLLRRVLDANDARRWSTPDDPLAT